MRAHGVRPGIGAGRRHFADLSRRCRPVGSGLAQRAGARRRVCHVVDGNPRKMLAERLELNSPHGRRVIGILLFQDLAVVPLLILYPAPGQGGEAVARELLIALAKAGLVLFLLSTVGREGKCILDRVRSGSAKSQGSGGRGRERGFRRSEVVAEIIDEQSDRLQPRLHSVTLPPGVRRSGENIKRDRSAPAQRGSNAGSLAQHPQLDAGPGNSSC